jgi:hypothetical protein
MRMAHDEFERWYMVKINAEIKKMPEYKVGIEVINVGGGIDLQVNPALIQYCVVCWL